MKLTISQDASMIIDTTPIKALVEACEALISEFPPGRPVLTGEVSASNMNKMESALKALKLRESDDRDEWYQELERVVKLTRNDHAGLDKEFFREYYDQGYTPVQTWNYILLLAQEKLIRDVEAGGRIEREIDDE